MDPIAVGILGVGHLTEHMVPGLVGGAAALRILLSPRNAERAEALKARFGLEIAEDNAALVTGSDVVLVGVRQFHAVDVVRGLPWRAGQTVVSCCAGLALDELAPHTGPAELVRAMPTIAARFGESPTCIYPDSKAATAVLSNCGPVLPLGREHDFNAATVAVCFSSLLLGLMAHMVEWNERAGLEPATARRLIGELTRSTGTLAREHPHAPLGQLLHELATPGSFTLKGLDALEAADGFAPWVEMSDTLLAKLRE